MRSYPFCTGEYVRKFGAMMILILCFGWVNAQIPKAILRVSPEPETANNSVNTDILVRFVKPVDRALSAALNDITLTAGGKQWNFDYKIAGEKSDLLILHPRNPLPVSSTIEVQIPSFEIAPGVMVPEYRFRFKTNAKEKFDAVNTFEGPIPSINNDGKTTIENASKRTIDGDIADQVPFLTNEASGDPDDYYFLSSMFSPGAKDRLSIVNGKGQMVFDRRMPFIPIDFKMFYDSTFAFASMGNGPENWFYIILNKNFQPIDTIRAMNGYALDFHELQKDPRTGNYFLLAQRTFTFDMSKVVMSGNENAIILDMVIQEIDKDRNLIFEWKCFDHLPITDAYGVNLTTPGPIDYIHCNALNLDTDTTLLLSSRHLNEITRIDRRNGSIIWRLGPTASTQYFSFPNDRTAFTYQHSPERLPNGNILLFDNGNLKAGARYSRAVEYHLDETRMVAEKVWEYVHDPEVASDFMGSVQRLENGNTVICWGSANPNITEVDSNNNIVFEGSFPNGVMSYRAKKYHIPGLIRPMQPAFSAPDTLRPCKLSDGNFQKSFFSSLKQYTPMVVTSDFQKYSMNAFNLDVILEDTSNNFYNFDRRDINLRYVRLNRRDTLLCDPNITFKVGMNDECIGSTYRWSNGDSTSEINVKVKPFNSKVWVTTMNGDLKQTDTLRYNVTPVNAFEVLGESNFTKPFQVFTYSVPWYKGATYDWKATNGNIISGFEGNAVQVQWGNKNENYLQCVITDQYGCVIPSPVATIVLNSNGTGMQELASRTGVTVYPVPFHDQLNLSGDRSFGIRVFDAEGKQLMQCEAWGNEFNLNTQSWAAGYYLIEITTGNDTVRAKVLKAEN